MANREEDQTLMYSISNNKYPKFNPIATFRKPLIVSERPDICKSCNRCQSKEFNIVGYCIWLDKLIHDPYIVLF